MGRLNKIHHCPSGCLHNGVPYVFSQEGIEKYMSKEEAWINIEIPFRMSINPFQYCLSVSEKRILIFGGKKCNQDCTDVSVFDTEQGTVDTYPGVLTFGVCS